MKSLKLIVPIALLAAACLTGCSGSGARGLLSYATQPGTPVLVTQPRTNEVIRTTAVTNVDGVVSIALNTNVVITPAVYYTNLVLSGSAQTLAAAASTAAQASGFPWAGLATEALCVGIPTVLLGWYNLFQRRKLQRNSDALTMTCEVATELKDNVETVLSCLREEDRDRLKQRLQSSQLAAGGEVAAFIRRLVKANA